VCAGLIAGVALAVKTLKPECKVIGVEPKNCRSLEVGPPSIRPYRLCCLCSFFSYTCMVLIDVCVQLSIEYPIALRVHQLV
jgi:hypothetical protein